MSREIENEFKIMLTQAEYEQILSMYEFRTIVQTNHYYDTDGLEMSAKHTTVRVRELEGKCLLQVKLPTEVSFSRVEISAELGEIPDFISAEELERFCGRKLPCVKRLGKLVTTRNICKFDGGEIDLDRSEYFDVVDYELEIEFSDEAKARAVLDEIRARTGIQPSVEVCSGKLHRFLAKFKNS